MQFLLVNPKKRLRANQALVNNWILGKATKNENLSACLDSLKVIVNKNRTQVRLQRNYLKFDLYLTNNSFFKELSQ
jgi:hypothetical protein